MGAMAYLIFLVILLVLLLKFSAPFTVLCSLDTLLFGLVPLSLF